MPQSHGILWLFWPELSWRSGNYFLMTPWECKHLEINYPPAIKHGSLETLPLTSMIFPSDLRMTCVYRGYSMMFHIFLRCSYNFPIVVPWFSQQPPSGSGMSIDGRTTLQRRSRMAFPCGCTQPVAGTLGHWGNKKIGQLIGKYRKGKRMKKM